MKIGVFGDSYCDKLYTADDTDRIWYRFLKTNLDCELDCYGEGGSSILFSARLIEKHARDYDLVIWCLTTPGRFSFPTNSNHNRSYHVTTAWDAVITDDLDLIKKHQTCVDYLKYIFDWNTENFVGRSIVNYIQTQFSNIMIIPCFPAPLSAEFNLYKVCEQEANHYFPGLELHEIYKDYRDVRPGHITIDNHKILAELIQKDLKPGVFQTDYANFVKPSSPLDRVFIKS